MMAMRGLRAYGSELKQRPIRLMSSWESATDHPIRMKRRTRHFINTRVRSQGPFPLLFSETSTSHLFTKQILVKTFVLPREMVFFTSTYLSLKTMQLFCRVSDYLIRSYNAEYAKTNQEGNVNFVLLQSPASANENLCMVAYISGKLKSTVSHTRFFSLLFCFIVLFYKCCILIYAKRISHMKTTIHSSLDYFNLFPLRCKTFSKDFGQALFLKTLGNNL